MGLRWQLLDLTTPVQAEQSFRNYSDFLSLGFPHGLSVAIFGATGNRTQMNAFVWCSSVCSRRTTMNNRGFSLWDQCQEKWLSRRGLIRGAAGTMFPAKALADISDPSQITDFDGFVGLTHIRGGGMGTDTTSGAMTGLRFRRTWGSAKASLLVQTANNIEAHSPLFDCTLTPVRLDRPASINR